MDEQGVVSMPFEEKSLEFKSSPTLPSKLSDGPFRLRQDSVVEQAPSSVQTDAQGRTWVDVYFATDRTRIDLTGSWVHTRLWLPVLLGVLVISMLIIGIACGVKRWVACVGTGIAFAMTVYFSQQAILGTQTLELLSRSSPIAFGTSRNETSAEAYPLHLGVSQVTLPPNHKTGQLERPSLLKLEWQEDDLKHVKLQRIQILNSQDFFGELRSNESKSALVFIHGFNVRFDDALRRTAQLSVDLEYQGVPILYSWPSRGKLQSYTQDEANVGWTVPHLEAFLLDLREKGNLKSIHVVAHSMGNRALLGAVERLGLKQPVGEPLLSRVVMAAPDVDSLEFQNRFSQLLQKVSSATTVYGSKNDRALMLSESLHGYDRLGLVSDHFGSQANVEMIDTSPLDLSALGHSYYGEIPLVIDDMKAFFATQFSARERPWLKSQQGTANRLVWRFSETLNNDIRK